MKIGIVVDSSCGLTKKEAEKRGWHFLPLFLNIDGKEYSDGIDIENNFLDYFKEDSISKTSCTPKHFISDLYNEIHDKYDKILVYGISKYLSSQTEYLTFEAKKYEKIRVVQSRAISLEIIRDITEILYQIKNDELTFNQAIDIVEKRADEEPTFLVFPKSLKPLVKGGRLSPSAAKLANLLKIVPVIGFMDGKLEKYSKGRMFESTIVKQTKKNYVNVEKKTKDNEKIFLSTLHTANDDVEKIASNIKEELQTIQPLNIKNIPSVIAIHLGYGAIVTCILRLKYPIQIYDF